MFNHKGRFFFIEMFFKEKVILSVRFFKHRLANWALFCQKRIKKRKRSTIFKTQERHYPQPNIKQIKPCCCLAMVTRCTWIMPSWNGHQGRFVFLRLTKIQVSVFGHFFVASGKAFSGIRGKGLKPCRCPKFWRLKRLYCPNFPKYEWIALRNSTDFPERLRIALTLVLKLSEFFSEWKAP